MVESRRSSLLVHREDENAQLFREGQTRASDVSFHGDILLLAAFG